MANPRVIDYYAILAVPPNADLPGIQTAYSRLSDELATQSYHDDTSRQALDLLNEAYSVLSAADTRREYDQVLFQTEFAVLEQRRAAEERRRRIGRLLVTASLAAIVVTQALVLAYIGRDYLADTFDLLLGPLIPGRAG